ncbi:GxGYxY sequence motif-containing protein [bacterium A37T11]|nr:GxGYxY sequence motif-containing protein [bacterium A37T11]
MGNRLLAQLMAKNLTGNWSLVKDSSTFLSYFSGCELNLNQDKDSLGVSWKWLSSSPHIDAYTLPLNGHEQTYLIKDRVWPYENFMGISYIPGSTGKASFLSGAYAGHFEIRTRYEIRSSQGKSWMTCKDVYALSADGQSLTVNHFRSDRSAPVNYVFRKVGSKLAYVHQMKNNWNLKEGVPENAFFVSLQGVVNSSAAKLYLEYPKDWEYKETNSLQGFYERRLDYHFLPIETVKKALDLFSAELKGYIIWDEQSRASLCVAFTLAGLEQAVVVTPDMIPLMESYHLPLVKDFGGQFIGKSDEEIFRWAFHTYGDSCSKDFIVWMGGADGDQIMPGIADFGIAKHAFFADLSTAPKDTQEYKLADSLMGIMNRFALVMGWHSYGKDLERNYVTLASKHGLRVEGLNTFPNLSFTSKTPPSADFTFKNNHQVVKINRMCQRRKFILPVYKQMDLGLAPGTAHSGDLSHMLGK